MTRVISPEEEIESIRADRDLLDNANIELNYDGFCANSWYCNISVEKQDAVVSHKDPMDGGTAAEAICLAAIKLYTKNESI